MFFQQQIIAKICLFNNDLNLTRSGYNEHFYQHKFLRKPMNQTNYVVFTPLRIALLIAIILSNAVALASFVFDGQPWAQALRVFGVVFIMLLVFVILLEMVWLHHRAKYVKDDPVYKKYQLAKWLYGFLFVLGLATGLVVLLLD